MCVFPTTDGEWSKVCQGVYDILANFVKFKGIILLLLVGKPLHSQCWPFQSCAQNHIVEEGRIFLPCFVLCDIVSLGNPHGRYCRTFVDYLLFGSLFFLLLLLLNVAWTKIYCQKVPFELVKRPYHRHRVPWLVRVLRGCETCLY